MSSDLISSLENFFKQYNFNIDREGAEIHKDMAPMSLKKLCSIYLISMALLVMPKQGRPLAFIYHQLLKRYFNC